MADTTQDHGATRVVPPADGAVHGYVGTVPDNTPNAAYTHPREEPAAPTKAGDKPKPARATTRT
ncbi:hypothetical protein [Pseudonocardia asaccharolytica]|uniref:Uncharacterized protein n=1 Tax=Pseudonocardia asaccharolytica DSM 44247 = NBRC 16224 TaxID=1123024 RepID=A0A511D3I8_9PSEU|nr:hypothetical protein [Pseudonocardia asaccharolytica]GEL19356.1 hypothetical protein PA7_31930 [Pseudonocardia asaccharolytica DSM 44247 = NBRC 16224]